MYEGKEVVFIHPVGVQFNGIIVGCDNKKGITIVYEEDPDGILFCMTPENSGDFYEKEFKLVEKGIKEGIVNWRGIVCQLINIDGKHLDMLLGEKDGGAEQEELRMICPFRK